MFGIGVGSPAPLSRRLDPESGSIEASQSILGMITLQERRALSAFAQGVWARGARRDAIIVEGGPFVGASTVALAEGLSRSILGRSERRERIWSYDLFETTPGMAEAYFGAAGPKAGESFRPLFDRNLAPFRDAVRVHEGDIRTAEAPDRPIALLFLDILWSWDATKVVSQGCYPLLDAGRSLLVHQDFVYPFYPWIVISMGLLSRELPFAYVVPHSSAVFDVARKVPPEAIDDGRNVPMGQALALYDGFIDRIDGWGKGALALGKAMLLASHRRTDEARVIVDEVEARFGEERLVLQYIPSVLKYCNRTDKEGVAKPLDQLGR